MTTSVALGVDDAPAPAETSRDIAAEIRQIDCPEYLAVADVACGIASVPLDRSAPELGDAEISFAAMEGAGAIARPMAVMQGGPGGASSELAAWFPQRLFPQVFIDQRGTGFAPVDFDCDEFDAALGDSFAELADDAVDTLDGSLAQCANRLADTSADHVALFAHATTANHANDVEAIMVALGYGEWTAYGVSYGSTIGFALLAEERDGMVGVVLDGVYPPDLDIEAGYAFSAQQSLDALTQACAASGPCRDSNDDVAASVERLLDRFAAEPVSLTVDGTMVVVDDVRLAEYVFLLSYSERQMRYLPAVLARIEAGDGTALQWLARTGSTTLLSAYGVNDEATYFAVTCHDRLPFIDGPTGDLSAYATALTSAPVGEACEPWGAKASSASAGAPVESDLPVLLLSGEFDPITPPAFAESAAEGFSNATLVTQAGRGHGIWVGDDCIGSIVDEFVADPGGTFDTACADVGVPVEWAQP